MTAPPRSLGNVPDGLPPPLEDFLVQSRRLLEELRRGQTTLATSVTGLSGIASAPGPSGSPGPPGPPAGPAVPDLTPPPTPSGVVVSAGIDFVFIQTDAPTFSVGRGYNRTLVYGTTYSGTGPLPTFGDAVLVHEFVGQVGSIAAVPGVQWHVWLRWRSNDGVLSTSPQGGTNGNQVTTAKIGNANLADLIITAEKLSAGTYSNINLVPNPAAEDGTQAWSLAWDTGLGTLATDPTIKTGGTQAFKLTKTAAQRVGSGTLAIPVIPGETYAWRLEWRGSSSESDGHWIRAYERTTAPSGGIVTSANLTSSTDLAANVGITTAFVEMKGTYTVPAGVFFVSLGVLNDTNSTNLDLYWDDVSLGRQITAEFMAAGSIAVGSAAIANLAVTGAMIADATIGNAKIVNVAASKLTAGSIAVGEFIQSSGFVTGVSGWRIDGGGTAEFGAASIRGQLVASQINTNGLTIRDSLGNLILGSGQFLAGGQNLLPNGSFEVDSDADGTPDGWVYGVNGALVASLRQLDPNAVHHGSWALRTDFTGSTSYAAGNAYYYAVSERLPNAGGRPFTASVYSTSDLNSPTFYILVNYLDGLGVQIGGSSSAEFSPFGVPTRYTHTFTPVAGTVFIRVFVNFWNDNAGATRIWFDAAKLEEGRVATEFSISPRDKVGLDNKITIGNATTFIDNAAINSAQIGSLNADVINAGRIRGIGVYAGTLATKGSYLTAALAGTESTISLKDTTDFPSSGSGWFYDTANDRDAFSWTGKTATTLTGCSGVSAHNLGATAVPAVKLMTIDTLTNEMRYLGARADGTIEEVASVGLSVLGTDLSIAAFGSSTWDPGTTGALALRVRAKTIFRVAEIANYQPDTSGIGLLVRHLGGGLALRAESPAGGLALHLVGGGVGGFNRAQVQFNVLPGRPGVANNGDVCMLYTTGGTVDNRTATPKLVYGDSGAWYAVETGLIWNG